MSANALYPALSHGDFQAAASFTERANTMVDVFFSCFDHRYTLLLRRWMPADARSTRPR
jgi:hypothetical protein